MKSAWQESTNVRRLKEQRESPRREAETNRPKVCNVCKKVADKLACKHAVLISLDANYVSNGDGLG